MSNKPPDRSLENMFIVSDQSTVRVTVRGTRRRGRGRGFGEPLRSGFVEGISSYGHRDSGP